MAAIAKKIAPAQAAAGVNQIAALGCPLKRKAQAAPPKRAEMHALEPEAQRAGDRGRRDDDAKRYPRRAHHADLQCQREQRRWSSISAMVMPVLRR
jgi:hypothetical protein